MGLYIPVHVKPSPVKPGLQTQVKLLSVSVQSALMSHSPPISHSLMSAHEYVSDKLSSILYCALRSQLQIRAYHGQCPCMYGAEVISFLATYVLCMHVYTHNPLLLIEDSFGKDCG